MTTHSDADRELIDEFGGDPEQDHDHPDQRAIPTLLKVAVLVAVALASAWIGWMLR